MGNIPLFTGFYTSQVLPGPRWCRISSNNSIIWLSYWVGRKNKWTLDFWQVFLAYSSTAAFHTGFWLCWTMCPVKNRRCTTQKLWFRLGLTDKWQEVIPAISSLCQGTACRIHKVPVRPNLLPRKRAVYLIFRCLHYKIWVNQTAIISATRDVLEWTSLLTCQSYSQLTGERLEGVLSVPVLSFHKIWFGHCSCPSNPCLQCLLILIPPNNTA